VFGFPSAEHVTIAAGVPFSSTGRISGGRRVIGISPLHRWDEASPRTWSGSLQVDFEDLELDGQRRRRHKRVKSVFGLVRHRPDGLYKAPANAVCDFDVSVLYSTMMPITALELVRLVRRERLDCDS
jgi:hypothetical protein